VREHELLYGGLGGNFGCLSCRRMTRLERALDFFLGEGRFVNENIGTRRRRDSRFRGT
jgi:hypothetical protein